MRVQWKGLRGPAVPSAVGSALADQLTEGERLLAWARDDATGEVVVAGRHRLYAVAGEGGNAQVTLARPWHLVDAGIWGEDDRLTVSWVDKEPVRRWHISDPQRLGQTLWERVQASVVLSETLDLGQRHSARVVVRRDQGTGGLLTQSILGPGVDPQDPQVRAAVAATLEALREQVGL